MNSWLHEIPNYRVFALVNTYNWTQIGRLGKSAASVNCLRLLKNGVYKRKMENINRWYKKPNRRKLNWILKLKTKELEKKNNMKKGLKRIALVSYSNTSICWMFTISFVIKNGNVSNWLVLRVCVCMLWPKIKRLAMMSIYSFFGCGPITFLKTICPWFFVRLGGN